ncbi:MAG: 50S ribosomal protein L29 [Alphaproteobacteria bacterium GM202ARS2]|nr:50S ribosomal protein L29 [Alphaproteobacteria bacterium GM202ARS2]
MKKAEEMRNMTQDELVSMLKTLASETLTMRFSRTTAQLDNTAQLRKNRRAYARALTILHQRKRGKDKQTASAPADSPKKEI